MAPVTGNYIFYIASDDQGELWFSTNDQSANKARVCYNTGRTESREWNKSSTQKSVPIALVVGRAYYYEAIMIETTGSDNLAIGWQHPGQTIIDVIPASASRLP